MKQIRCSYLVITILLTSFCLFGCANDNETYQNPIYPDSSIATLSWNTLGGGDLAFQVDSEDEEPFIITVTRYNFSDMGEGITIRAAPISLDIQLLLSDIFNKQLDLNDYTAATNLPTGTWTSITLSFENDPDLVIDDIDMGSKLADLYDFVVDALDYGYQEPVYPDGNIIGLTWSTQGGGHLKFTVVEETDGTFTITVEEYNFNFSMVNEIYSLTNSDPDVYLMVDDIFKKNTDIFDHTFFPQPGLATGTWTSITLTYSNGQEVEIKHIESGGELSLLYSYVSDRLESQ